MYKYLRTWPKDRENGWSHELNGVCHDVNNWFFTQDGNLWKFPVTHRIGDTVNGENKAKGILKNHYGHHLGDIDCYKGYIFVPVTGDGDPYIAIFSARDLSFVAKQNIRRNGKYYSSLGWCAIDQQSGLLYTSDKICTDTFSENSSPVMVYKIIFDYLDDKCGCGHTIFLAPYAQMVLLDEQGKPLYREHMQGGCFDNEKHLHIINGYVTGKDGKTWANSKGGISVFTVPQNISEKGSYRIQRIAGSGQTSRSEFRYQFNGTGEEPQGLTYWDLNKDARAPEISGVLHAIMLDNVGRGDDDFYFKHYDRV